MKYYHAVGGLARTHIEMVRDIPCLLSFQEVARCKSLPEDVFIDSGAFYYFIRQKKEEYPISIEQFLTVLEKLDFSYFAFQDYPTHDCNFEDGIRRTIKRMIETDLLLDSFRNLRAKAVPVIQGNSPKDYIKAIDEHKNLLKNYSLIAIGSVCMANFWRKVYPLLSILPKEYRYHVFGQQPWTIPYLLGLEHVFSVDGGDAGASASKHKISYYKANFAGRYRQFPDKPFQEVFLENIYQSRLFARTKQIQLENTII